jgi:hypothetical protein
MGFRVLADDPISEVPRLGPEILRTVNVTHAGQMSNDTSVFPVALLENAATRPIADQAEEVSFT